MPKLKEIAPGHEVACFYVESMQNQQREADSMMKKILTLMMSTALLFGTQSTVFADTGNYAEGDVHTIGVILYDPEHCTEQCKKEMPELKEIAPGHEVACFYVENITK